MLVSSGAYPDAKDCEGATPLYRAARGGEQEVVKLLLTLGADPNVVAENGWSPLHEASRWGRTDVIKIIIESGGEVHATTPMDETPLHLAAFWGRSWDDADPTNLLLRVGGADVTAKNVNGETPLDVAIANFMLEDFEECEEILKRLSHGDPSISTTCGAPLDLMRALFDAVYCDPTFS